jgi:hypothetical protein
MLAHPSESSARPHFLPAHAHILRDCLAENPILVGPHESTVIKFAVGPSAADLGNVRSLEIPAARDMRIQATTQRVWHMGRAVFRLSPNSSASDLDLIASACVIIAHVELSTQPAAPLRYSVDIFLGDCIDVVVPIPEDAEKGAEVVLRNLSIAGCIVELGEAPVRIIVGFNHEPAPQGRVYVVSGSSDIHALSQALDDGCSTQELDRVSAKHIMAVTGCKRTMAMQVNTTALTKYVCGPTGLLDISNA